MSSLNDGERHHVMRQLKGERSRLLGLQHRLKGTDARRHPTAWQALEQRAREVAARIATLDAQLSAPTIAQDIDNSALQVMTAQEAKDAIRRRLHLVLIMLNSLPEGCDAAVATLRAAIDIELKRLVAIKGGRHAAQ